MMDDDLQPAFVERYARHSLALSTTVSSLILNPLMVDIGHEDFTSGRRAQLAKPVVKPARLG